MFSKEFYILILWIICFCLYEFEKETGLFKNKTVFSYTQIDNSESQIVSLNDQYKNIPPQYYQDDDGKVKVKNKFNEKRNF